MTGFRKEEQGLSLPEAYLMGVTKLFRTAGVVFLGLVLFDMYFMIKTHLLEKDKPPQLGG